MKGTETMKGTGPMSGSVAANGTRAAAGRQSVEGLGVAVLGLGRSGRAAARLAQARGAASVYASDAAAGPALEAARSELEALGIEVELGRHDPERIAACDLAVLSPGIPRAATPLAVLSGVRTIGEIELASWYLEAHLAAVTGTNGKTTTTALLEAICRSGGVRGVAAGNIGLPLADVALAGDRLDWAVCEVSSFQLGTTETFHPRIGVLTNLAPDHLDRYANLAAYAADKERLAANMGPEDALVLNADDPGSRVFAPDARATRWTFTAGTPARPGVGVVGGRIVQLLPGGRSRSVAAVGEIRLRGPHNLQNVLAASLAALLMGIEPEAVAAALSEFAGVPNRLEDVATIDGVLFVNDSKATNVDATRWALKSFDAPLHLILGGRHKGSPYTPLLGEAAGRVRQVLALGEAREAIARDLGGRLPVRLVDTLEEAVGAAFREAASGEVVLLSPACSSYDMFRDYEARGEAFREAVRGLEKRPATGRASAPREGG